MAEHTIWEGKLREASVRPLMPADEEDGGSAGGQAGGAGFDAAAWAEVSVCRCLT